MAHTAAAVESSRIESSMNDSSTAPSADAALVQSDDGRLERPIATAAASPFHRLPLPFRLPSPCSFPSSPGAIPPPVFTRWVAHQQFYDVDSSAEEHIQTDRSSCCSAGSCRLSSHLNSSLSNSMLCTCACQLNKLALTLFKDGRLLASGSTPEEEQQSRPAAS